MLRRYQFACIAMGLKPIAMQAFLQMLITDQNYEL